MASSPSPLSPLSTVLSFIYIDLSISLIPPSILSLKFFSTWQNHPPIVPLLCCLSSLVTLTLSLAHRIQQIESTLVLQTSVQLLPDCPVPTSRLSSTTTVASSMNVQWHMSPPPHSCLLSLLSLYLKLILITLNLNSLVKCLLTTNMLKDLREQRLGSAHHYICSC